MVSISKEANNTIRVAIDSVGCKLNQAEVELLARQFAGAGYVLVSPDDEADIYILNTCTVTHVADRKCRNRLRQAQQRNPGALVVATGCYAERAPESLKQLGAVGLIIGNKEKESLLEIITGSGRAHPVAPAARPDGRTRAFVKIQDGCSKFCSYCIVPLVRGAEKSVPANQVIEEIKDRAASGYKEVVLTGTEIGSYRSDGINLEGLIRRIRLETGVNRLRLSSLQAQEIAPGLIDLWQDRRLCRHIHLPLQSGSDEVLARMNRRYRTAGYRRAVELIRARIPDAAITTDVIVGFPGETEAEFGQSLDFCREMGFARIHVFPYSPRPGTAAAGSPAIADKVKRERAERMLALAGKSAESFRERSLGRTMSVLWEQQARGVWSGLTDNYIRVYAKASDNLADQILPVKLTRLYRDGVWGEVELQY